MIKKHYSITMNTALIHFKSFNGKTCWWRWFISCIITPACRDSNL